MQTSSSSFFPQVWERNTVSVVFYLAFCKSIDFGWKTPCSLQGGLVVVFSLGSSPTVDTANRAKRLQPNINTSGSGLRFNRIYGTPNKTQHKLYLATILDHVVNTGIVL